MPMLSTGAFVLEHEIRATLENDRFFLRLAEKAGWEKMAADLRANIAVYEEAEQRFWRSVEGSD